MNHTGTTREQRVIKSFVALADTMVDDYDMLDLLDRLINDSVQLLAADAAAIMLVDPQQRLRVVASSSEDAELMELLQLEADEGPCVDCVASRAPVQIADLATASQRWPRFVSAATARGAYRSVHALPLRLRRDGIGAMNLFHREPGALPDADVALGQALADVATIGIMSERAIHRGEALNEQLQFALNSRVIIEQAKGVLAERSGLSMNAAFDRLRRYARDRNLRLADVARQVAETGLATDVLAAPPPADPAPETT